MEVRQDTAESGLHEPSCSTLPAKKMFCSPKVNTSSHKNVVEADLAERRVSSLLKGDRHRGARGALRACVDRDSVARGHARCEGTTRDREAARSSTTVFSTRGTARHSRAPRTHTLHARATDNIAVGPVRQLTLEACVPHAVRVIYRNEARRTCDHPISPLTQVCIKLDVNSPRPKAICSACGDTQPFIAAVPTSLWKPTIPATAAHRCWHSQPFMPPSVVHVPAPFHAYSQHSSQSAKKKGHTAVRSARVRVCEADVTGEDRWRAV